MGFFSKLFGNNQSPKQNSPEHAVLVQFKYGSTDLQPIFDLEEQLEEVIDDAGVGEFDGNEIAADGSDGTLYMYGPDADRLFKVVCPVLESAGFMQGATVLLRYGPPEEGVKSMQVTVGK